MFNSDQGVTTAVDDTHELGQYELLRMPVFLTDGLTIALRSYSANSVVSCKFTDGCHKYRHDEIMMVIFVDQISLVS